MSSQLSPKLMTWEKHFEQDCDTCDARNDSKQDLMVKQDDGGGGPFYVIETERWAFDYLEDLIEFLETAGVQRRPTEVAA